MTLKRMIMIIRISVMKNGFIRAEYLKRKKVFAEMGRHCFWQPRNVPPEAGLISMGDNVCVASEVLFINHDVVHHVFNGMELGEAHKYSLFLGAIKIGNNVFIGSRCCILPGTMIGNNVIIGAGSVVTGLLPSGGVYAGVPARRIGEFESIRQNRKADNDSRPKVERFPEVWQQFREKYDGINEA